MGDGLRLDSEELADELSRKSRLPGSALVLGVRDYVDKNGFPGVVLGLSGGVDSALTLAVAVAALGSERVEAVMMPFRYTSVHEYCRRRRAEPRRWAVSHKRDPHRRRCTRRSWMRSSDEFAGLPADSTEENLQARCRGVLLMSISNKKGALVLTTGNKSELAVGYSTLYGDMAGGFDVLKDVPKTLVYDAVPLSATTLGPCIPDRVIERPPSAELRPDQKDEDSLPPYDILDRILELYVEQRLERRGDHSPRASNGSTSNADTCCSSIAMSTSDDRRRSVCASRSAASVATAAIRSPRPGASESRADARTVAVVSVAAAIELRRFRRIEESEAEPCLSVERCSPGRRCRRCRTPRDCDRGRRGPGSSGAAPSMAFSARSSMPIRTGIPVPSRPGRRQTAGVRWKVFHNVAATIGRGEVGTAAEVVVGDVNLVARHEIAQMHHARPGIRRVGAVVDSARHELRELGEGLLGEADIALGGLSDVAKRDRRSWLEDEVARPCM